MSLSLGNVVNAPAQPDAARVVSIRQLPDFADVHAQLQALVNTFGFHEINQFCVLTYALPKGDTEWTPFVYWPTQNKLIEWGIGTDVLLGSNHYFDLTRDVLPDGVNTSPDYLTRSGVNQVIKDCEARGDKYTVRKTSGGWVSIWKFAQFSSIQSQLQDFVQHNPGPKISKFCVIGQKDGPFLGAYVYWISGNMLAFWFPDSNDQFRTDVLTDSNIQINLKHGLQNEEDSSDDRTEMQRSYAFAIFNACQKSGENLKIEKSY